VKSRGDLWASRPESSISFSFLESPPPRRADLARRGCRNHRRPHPGALLFAAIIEDRTMTSFRAKLRDTQGVITTNGLVPPRM
jgi:hypothetical protein